MRCGEVREYLFAFVDNELDAPLNMEFQRHLDSCAECAHDLELEWTIKRRLGQALATAGREVPFDRRALEAITTTSCEPSDVRRKRLRCVALPIVVAAAIALGLGGWAALRTQPTARGKDRLASAVVSDLLHVLAEPEPLELTAGDRRVVSDWLREKTKLDLVLPPSRGSHRTLLGGRTCRLEGRPAAFALYALDGVPASLVVIQADRSTLRGMPQGHRRGQPYWVERLRGHTVAAVRHDGLAYIAVSRHPEAKLLGLLDDVVDERDSPFGAATKAKSRARPSAASRDSRLAQNAALCRARPAVVRSRRWDRASTHRDERPPWCEGAVRCELACKSLVRVSSVCSSRAVRARPSTA